MRIVTLEEHVLTPRFAGARKDLDEAPSPELSRMMEPALMDMGEGRLQAMDSAGIAMQVLSLAASGLDQLPDDEGAAVARDANDQIGAAIHRHPDRFAGFATLALSDVLTAVTEARRAVEELGFSGVMLHGTVRGLPCSDDIFEPVWEEIERLDVPVYLHPGTLPPEVMSTYYTGLPERQPELLAITTWDWHRESSLQVLRLIVSGLFDRFPRLRLIVGHLGEHLPSSITRAAGILDLLASRLARPVEAYFREHFWVTTSGYFKPEPFHRAAEVVGMDRMLFSTDYPFGSTHRGRRFLDSLELGREELEKLAHANADRLFGWS